MVTLETIESIRNDILKHLKGTDGNKHFYQCALDAINVARQNLNRANWSDHEHRYAHTIAVSEWTSIAENWLQQALDREEV